MTTRTLALLGSLLLGLGVFAWVTRLQPPAQRAERNESGRVAAAERDLQEERAKRAALQREVERLQKEAVEPEPEPEPEPVEPEAPMTDEEFKKELQAFGENLRSVILGDAKEPVERLRKALERGGQKRLKKLIQRFGDPTEAMGPRLVLAHILGQSNDKEAIQALASAVRDPDSGMLVHRFASHALAFSEAEEATAILTEVARNDEDIGARANAAFGLARRDIAEGLDLYFTATDEAFELGDPAALQYLVGFRLLGDKALPGVRERLLTYKNDQAVLVLIASVKEARDKESIPALEQLAYDSSRSTSIQKAAQAALQVIRPGTG